MSIRRSGSIFVSLASVAGLFACSGAGSPVDVGTDFSDMRHRHDSGSSGGIDSGVDVVTSPPDSGNNPPPDTGTTGENDFGLGRDAPDDPALALAPNLSPIVGGDPGSMTGNGTLHSATDVDCYKLTLGSNVTSTIGYSVGFCGSQWTWPDGPPSSTTVAWTLWQLTPTGVFEAPNPAGSGGCGALSCCGSGSSMAAFTTIGPNTIAWYAPGDYALCFHNAYASPDPGASGYGPYRGDFVFTP
jgi:hypothetical protein